MLFFAFNRRRVEKLIEMFGFTDDEELLNWANLHLNIGIISFFEKLPFGWSDYTFSLEIRDKKVIGKGFSIGSFFWRKEKKKVLQMFEYLFKKYTNCYLGEILNEEKLLLSDIMIFGFGKRFYKSGIVETKIYFGLQNGLIYGWNVVNGQVYSKIYFKEESSIYKVKAKDKKGGRTQIDVDLNGKQALKFIEHLDIEENDKEYLKSLFSKGIEPTNHPAYLDTISLHFLGLTLYID